jgi:tripartite-type tricarboxylate transporter receptor subunit TctC
MFATNLTHAAAMQLMREPGNDRVRDFVPVTLTSIVPLVLMVDADAPARAVVAFFGEARVRAGALNYRTGSIGSLAATQLSIGSTAISAERISCRRTPAVTDLLAGRIHFMVSDLAAAGEYVQAGNLRAPGVTPARRIPMLPDVPTLQEAGVPGYDLASPVAALPPARSPEAVVVRLNREIDAVLDSEDGRRFSVGLGLVSSTGAPEEPAHFQRRK